MTNNKGVTLVELAVVAMIFALAIMILTPFVQLARDRASIIKCENNIRKISLALHFYAADNNEAFPPNLGALYPNYIKDEKTFDCPASKIRGTPEKPDYDYIADLKESSPQSEVIVYDSDGNHKKWGRNILRINGSVEWVRKGAGKPR